MSDSSQRGNRSLSINTRVDTTDPARVIQTRRSFQPEVLIQRWNKRAGAPREKRNKRERTSGEMRTSLLRAAWSVVSAIGGGAAFSKSLHRVLHTARMGCTKRRTEHSRAREPWDSRQAEDGALPCAGPRVFDPPSLHTGAGELQPEDDSLSSEQLLDLAEKVRATVTGRQRISILQLRS